MIRRLFAVGISKPISLTLSAGTTQLPWRDHAIFNLACQASKKNPVRVQRCRSQKYTNVRFDFRATGKTKKTLCLCFDHQTLVDYFLGLAALPDFNVASKLCTAAVKASSRTSLKRITPFTSIT